MKLVLIFILRTFAILTCAYIVPGVNVDDFSTAIWVALVMGLLNMLLKPILILLTLPVTIFTFGLFLIVINAILVLVTADIIPEFQVEGFFAAFVFSLLLSMMNVLMDKFIEKRPPHNEQEEYE